MLKKENKYYVLLGSITCNLEFNLKFSGWRTNDIFNSSCFGWVSKVC